MSLDIFSDAMSIAVGSKCLDSIDRQCVSEFNAAFSLFSINIYPKQISIQI